MLIAGFRGLSVTAESPIVDDIRSRHLGGVVILERDFETGSRDRNIATPRQLRALIRSLQAMAPVPLFVAMTQEGGQVARLHQGNGFLATDSARVLGQAGQEDQTATFEASRTIAHQLADVGINLNFAPVVDLDVEPDNPIIGLRERSFGPNPLLVTQHAKAFIAAHRQAGVLTAVKHFPGHGSSLADTHHGLVDVTSTWSWPELLPYSLLMDDPGLDMVMTAHVCLRDVGGDAPATLSRDVITGLLRGEIGFDGVVVTDGMQMGAIAARYSHEEAAVMAIEAGADILLYPNYSEYDPQIVSRMHRHLVAIVRAGVVSEERIDLSYRRIMRLKDRLLAGKTDG